MSYEDWTATGKQQFWADFKKQLLVDTLGGPTVGVGNEPTLANMRQRLFALLPASVRDAQGNVTGVDRTELLNAILNVGQFPNGQTLADRFFHLEQTLADIEAAIAAIPTGGGPVSYTMTGTLDPKATP